MKASDWQSIIFDFDGVVVESGDIKTQAFADLYKIHGEDVMNGVIAYHARNGGLSRYQKFRYFQEHLLGRPPLTAAEEKVLDQEFSALVVEAVIASQPVPGAVELLQQESRKIPLFVASGTPEQELKIIVSRRNLAHYFTAVRGSPIPKHQLIAEILRSHHLTPSRVLMLGDALIDFESADVNGVSFLGRVRTGDTNPFPPHVRIVADLNPLLDQPVHCLSG